MKINKKFIEEQIKKLDPKLKKNDEVFKIATILLSGLEVGADSKAIAKFLDIDIKDVEKYEKNLRKGKVWQGKKTACEWFEKDGGIAFWMDVLVAQGLVERTSSKRQPTKKGKATKKKVKASRKYKRVNY